MIDFFKRTYNNSKLEKLDNFKNGCWINVVDPNNLELNQLSKKLNLNLELLKEGLDQHELPRMEISGNNTYIYVKTTQYETLNINTLLIVVGKTFILTLSKNSVLAIEDFIEGKKKIITTKRLKSSIDILLNINEDIEKSVFFILKNIQNKKNITQDLKNKDIEVLLLYEDFLNKLISNYNYTTLLYTKILKNLKLSQEDKKDLENLIIESEEGLNICKSSLKTISNITNYYSIILSNNLNNTIKLLTILTITINIPAVVGSIYGMNISLPFQKNPFAFFYIIILIIILIIIFLIFIKNKK